MSRAVRGAGMVIAGVPCELGMTTTGAAVACGVGPGAGVCISIFTNLRIVRFQRPLG
jgi:hypothetical protein